MCGVKRRRFIALFGYKLNQFDLRKYPHSHRLTNQAYTSDITVTEISRHFTYKMAAKHGGHRMTWERTVTACIYALSSSVRPSVCLFVCLSLTRRYCIEMSVNSDSLTFRGPIYKISYDLSSDYRKFFVRSTYYSDLKVLKISFRNIVS